MMESNRSTGGRPRDTFADSHLLPVEDEEGNLIAKTCRHCGHRFSIRTSVTRVKAHLGGVPGQGVAPCNHVPFNVKEAARNAMPSSSSKSSNANIPSNSDTQQSPTQECYTSGPPPPQIMQSTQEQCPRQSDGLESNFSEKDTDPLDMEMLERFQSIFADIRFQIEPVNTQECFMNDEANLPQETLASQEVPEVPRYTQQPDGSFSSGTLASEHPMQHLREDPNCFPGQELLHDSARMDSTHIASIPHDSLQEGEACPRSAYQEDMSIAELNYHEGLESQHHAYPRSAYQEDMLIAELNYQEGLESQHHRMQENLQGDQMVRSLNQNVSPSIVSQMHPMHIDVLHESLDTPTSTLDQAKQEKKRKFHDRRPVGKTLPLGSIFQGPTFKNKVDDICESLEDDSVSRIGVYGMGGSGKTTIMKFIHNLLLEGCFMPSSHVIWVTVSQDRTISQLQHHLASLLKIELSRDEDEVAWAASLHEEMQKMRYALILDDVWDKINLEEVGIPEPSRDNGCKLILTTRSFDVCRRMQCKPIFLDLLSEKEAWELFVKTLDVDPEKSTIQDIMKEVSKECACLPLAIITIAGSMRGVLNVHEWRVALDSLRNRTYGFTNMKDQVLEILKFSYYRLSEQLQKYLLICALYPEDTEIRVGHMMIVMFFMEGTFGSKESLRSTIDHFQTILNKLKYACLLTRVSNDDYFVIHDLIRDMCLDIMGDRFLVKCCSKSFPDLSEYKEDVEKVSLIGSEFEEIPSNMMPYCPKLSMLLLSMNENLTSIPDSFFMSFPKLELLDLSGTSIEELPSSVTNLVSLNALVLNECTKLRCLPCLAPLKALKLLTLFDSRIEEAPEGLEKLVNLTFLLLGDRDIQTVSRLDLTDLVKLRALGLLDQVKIMMKDVKEFKNLDFLEAEFANWEEFSGYVRSVLNSRRGPSSYVIKAELTCVGASCASMSYKISKESKEEGIMAELWLLEDSDVIGQIPSPEIVQDLRIYISRSILHQGEIEENGGLRGLFDATYLSAFVNLVRLRVSYLKFTKHLISASSLVVESISSPKVLPCFQNLQELHIDDCKSLESILVSSANPTGKEETNNPISFPNLCKLVLWKLPNLRSIWDGTLTCPSIEYIWVEECPKLKRLPLQVPPPPLVLDNNNNSRQLSPLPPPLSSLKEIEGESEWWESLEWDQPHAKPLLQPYFKDPLEPLLLSPRRSPLRTIN